MHIAWLGKKSPFCGNVTYGREITNALLDRGHRVTFLHFAQPSEEVESNCGDEENGFTSVYAWAPGQPATLLPDNVGLPFGDNEGMSSLRMVIHYDNPQGIENVLDSSGVRYYYTTQPREHELGFLGIGDSTVRKRGEPVGVGLTSHTFTCPSS